VIVYEKQQLDIPGGGNPAVQVRPAEAVDLAEVLRIDRACFEAQWTKDDTILGPAVAQGPYFVVAAIEGVSVGYAYATTHFGGRLVHLVRIAVDPARQGQGIGVRLLADLTAYAEEIGATMMTLNTQAYNQSAQRLYRWFGFSVTGERRLVLRRSLV
jgi:[ribosomal protein S18]-alanine N-acetyltransferase